MSQAAQKPSSVVTALDFFVGILKEHVSQGKTLKLSLMCVFVPSPFFQMLRLASVQQNTSTGSTDVIFKGRSQSVKSKFLGLTLLGKLQLLCGVETQVQKLWYPVSKLAFHFQDLYSEFALSQPSKRQNIKGNVQPVGERCIMWDVEASREADHKLNNWKKGRTLATAQY